MRGAALFSELFAQPGARQPACALTVGHDVGDWLAVYGQGHAFTGPYRVKDLTGPIAQIADAYLHVRQRSTSA